MIVTSLGDAHLARQSLDSFLSATSPAMNPLPKEFRSTIKAEQEVWTRQAARATGKGHLESAVLHLEQGTGGSSTLIETLRSDIARLGDGSEAVQIGDIRAHAKDGVNALSTAIEQAHPRLKLSHVLIGAALCGVVAYAFAHGKGE